MCTLLVVGFILIIILHNTIIDSLIKLMFVCMRPKLPRFGSVIMLLFFNLQVAISLSLIVFHGLSGYIKNTISVQEHGPFCCQCGHVLGARPSPVHATVGARVLSSAPSLSGGEEAPTSLSSSIGSQPSQTGPPGPRRSPGQECRGSTLLKAPGSPQHG